MPGNWSESEVQAAVEDYFNMLRLELTGRQYNKTEHRHALMQRLSNRSDGSIEKKHQNISAVLIEMGIPSIAGYKPLYNYQRSLLPEVVSEFLRSHPDLQSLFQADSEALPDIPTVQDFLAALEAPPVPDQRRVSAVVEAKPIYSPLGVDYLELEARNQSLGEAGERFVINYERARLIHAGKESLVDRIEQVSATVGPSAGFDIRSFEENGKDRFIEAKTTRHGKDTPFFVTPNELKCSRENAQRYFLYRVFGFRSNPRLFALKGRLDERFALEPSQYRATGVIMGG